MRSLITLQLQVNKRLRHAIDDFCWRCVGWLSDQDTETARQNVLACPQLDCPLHSVRRGSELYRHRPSEEAIRLVAMAAHRHPNEKPWNKEEERKLLDWRDEGLPYWWIAAQLRRPELTVSLRWRKLNRIMNPPDPLKGLVLRDEDED